MPKLDLKVENRQIEFLKNQLLCGDNAKLCRGGVNHDPKFFVGVVDDLQKKFQPLFSIFCLPKKITIGYKMSKNPNFWHLEGNTSPVNHLCFRVHMFFNHQSHLAQCIKKNISLQAYINAKRPKNIYFGGIKDKKLIIYPP